MAPQGRLCWKEGGEQPAAQEHHCRPEGSMDLKSGLNPQHQFPDPQTGLFPVGLPALPLQANPPPITPVSSTVSLLLVPWTALCTSTLMYIYIEIQALRGRGTRRWLVSGSPAGEASLGPQPGDCPSLQVHQLRGKTLQGSKAEFHS